MKCNIKGIVYNPLDPKTDFYNLINDSLYNDSLFIFNDNEEKHFTNVKGAGNASIRIYNEFGKYKNYPRSAGIPTGTLKNGGYRTLNIKNKKVIDDSIDRIKNLNKKYKYKNIYFSKNPKNNLIGTSIFSPGNDVLEYITSNIYNLCKGVNVKRVKSRFKTVKSRVKSRVKTVKSRVKSRFKTVKSRVKTVKSRVKSRVVKRVKSRVKKI
jgi:hypothetical protein